MTKTAPIGSATAGVSSTHDSLPPPTAHVGIADERRATAAQGSSVPAAGNEGTGGVSVESPSQRRQGVDLKTSLRSAINQEDERIGATPVEADKNVPQNVLDMTHELAQQYVNEARDRFNRAEQALAANQQSHRRRTERTNAADALSGAELFLRLATADRENKSQAAEATAHQQYSMEMAAYGKMDATSPEAQAAFRSTWKWEIAFRLACKARDEVPRRLQ